MNLLTISCPCCGFSREIPAERVPEGERKVTCPRCKAAFQFRKPAAGAVETQEPLPPSQPPQPQAQPQPEPPPQPQPQPQQRPTPGTAWRARPARTELPDIAELFKESWQLFQRRFSTLIGLFLLSVVGFVAPVAIAVALGALLGMAAGKGAVVAVGALGAVGSVYAGLRFFSAFLHAVADERLCLKDALARGKGMVWPLLWVGLLSGFIICGGFMLLVVPGIIFTVWFCLAQFVLVGEDSRGMGALLKSREYVRGQWFNVALRLLLVWAASLLIGAIPVAGMILGIVFLPYVTIFHYLIYRDLRAIKGEVAYDCGISDRVKWPALALLGYLILPVLLVSVLGVSLLAPLGQLTSKQGGTLIPAVSALQADSAPQADSGAEGYRVITFPEKAAPAPEAPAAQPGLPSATGTPVPQGVEGEEPADLSIFIYAVNYTGSVKANGTVIRELEGKPDMQYNYNMGGRSLRYGANQIEVDFAELPSHQQSLLGVHMKVSRYRPGQESEVLGEWRFEEKGRGTRTFNLDIPK